MYTASVLPGAVPWNVTVPQILGELLGQSGVGWRPSLHAAVAATAVSATETLPNRRPHRRLGMGAIFGAARRGVNLTPHFSRNNVGFAMPIYEYRCTKCRKRFSQQEGIEEHGRRRPACPHCKSRAVEQVFSPFFAKTVRKS